MKEFFLILFFSKTVLLTPNPIMLNGEIQLIPKDPLEAITTGASIQIDVSSMIKQGEDEGFLEFDKRLLESFPAGAINAKLIGNDKTEVMLTYEGASLTNKESTMLSLYSEGGVPTDIEFNKVVVTSNIELKDIKIYWKNFKH